MTLDDYAALIALWLRAGLTHRPRGRDSRVEIDRQLRDGRVAILGLEMDERLIGAVVVSEDGRKGWINRLAVDPEYRRRSLGAHLIAAAEEELARRGLKIYAALIEPENAASLSLFERAGYQKFEGMIYVSKRESPDV